MHGTTLRATLTTLSGLNCPAAVEAVLIEVTGVSMSVEDGVYGEACEVW